MPALPILLRALVGLLFAGLLVAGCASSPAPVKSGDRPGSIVEAEETLASAEADLTSTLVDGDTGIVGGGEAVPPPPTAHRPGVAQSEGDRRVHRCSRACKALASMERAADGLCELAGDGDERCQSARVRVQSARELVRRTCPSCG